MTGCPPGGWNIRMTDQLRCSFRNGKLIYLRSNASNEFWAALLEKAYAKFHGSYAAIEGGISSDAAVDFTGGIPQIVNIDHNMEEKEKEKLFHLLELSSANGALISASLGGLTSPQEIYFIQFPRRDSQPRGSEERSDGWPRLQCEQGGGYQEMVDISTSPAHQVNIQKVCSHSLSIFRLRNPHGSGEEWTGDWSDGSKLWDNIPQGGKDEMVKSK